MKRDQKRKWVYVGRLYLLLLTLTLSFTLSAQNQKTISGVVIDNKGESIIGASILENGTQNGTITDIDGKFSLNVSEDAVITVSFIGMASQEVPVGAEIFFNITLKEDVIGLEEVVAIGYGAVKKKDLTGSVVSINTDDFKSLPTPSVGNAMQGKASGVQVVGSGTPGSDPTFRIRGTGTINNNNPLYVIDGVPTDGGLNQLNMDDVEGIQILKDASATAIYGSRGANGVVIITTKKGKKGEGVINFNCYYGVQQATNMVEVLNASEFAELHNEMMLAAGKDLNPAFADPSSLGKGTDWVGELFSVAPVQNYSLSYSGGNDKNTYYVSGNYFNQEGIVENTGFKRYTVKFNSETQVNTKVKFGNMLSLNHDDKYNGDYSIINTLRALPTQAIYNTDGTYSGPEGRPDWNGDIGNPIGRARVIDNRTLGYNLLGSVFGEVEIIKGLKFKTSAGLKANFWHGRTWSPKYDWKPTPQEESYLGEGWNKAITWNWDNTLTYDKTFNELHKFTALVGTSAQESKFKSINGSIQEFASDATQQLSNGLSQVVLGGGANDWALLSYMGRINYAFADKYLVTGTIRRDGSSRFGENNKWGLFPSGSLAWRVSEESFMQNMEAIDNLKLRAGFGITGNQEIGNYAYASELDIVKYNFNNNLVNAVVANRMPNPNVQWESQQQVNLGIDVTAFQQIVDITVDAYLKKTKDMLVPMDVPIVSGYSDVYVPMINAGEIENKGIELSVTTHNMKGEFNWDTDFNISFNRNKVIDLNDTIPMVRGDVGFNQQIARLEVGKPVDVFYGFVTDGVFQTQQDVDNHAIQVPGDDIYARTSAGDIRFKDLNSDGVINDDDRTIIGDPNPDFIFAINNRLSYKGFDLNVFIQGVYGNDIYNANRITNEGMAVAYNQSKETLKRWNGEGTSNSIPRAVFNDPNKNIRPSDRFIEDGSYIRLKSVVLGYSFPKKWIEKAGMSSARLYVSGTNLLTFTSYSGFDPEVGINGIDNSTYPLTRTVSVGANISF
ncbi:SusC/RagA family TonB-linked outer membrane protein [Carboxylicivirga caseinilyticus]|uniref:SusC/RagA family TonB-linked outer membrane protein n=1 Tax=Carboxylicivirga caseinilyticus TaxID=3417572 RepID=UPI003D33CAF7|nr:TonB-dependent receptor [Marinilabiliaceae bacterium A049]